MLARLLHAHASAAVEGVHFSFFPERAGPGHYAGTPLVAVGSAASSGSAEERIRQDVESAAGEKPFATNREKEIAAKKREAFLKMRKNSTATPGPKGTGKKGKNLNPKPEGLSPWTYTLLPTLAHSSWLVSNPGGLNPKP